MEMKQRGFEMFQFEIKTDYACHYANDVFEDSSSIILVVSTALHSKLKRKIFKRSLFFMLVYLSEKKYLNGRKIKHIQGCK